jgi:hypothetical protein
MECGESTQLAASPVLNLWPLNWSHLGDSFAAVGVIASPSRPCFSSTSASNLRELTTRSD